MLAGLKRWRSSHSGDVASVAAEHRKFKGLADRKLILMRISPNVAEHCI